MSDFNLGYKTAKFEFNNPNPEFTLDGKTREFNDGFAQFMREQEFLAGNPDTDSFDY